MERDPHVVLGVHRTTDWKVIRSAYLALARRYHPDGASPDGARMATINAAYEALEREHLAAIEAAMTPPQVGRVKAAGSKGGPERGSLLWRMQASGDDESPVLDFGPHAGRRIAEIARQDPRYLRWLSRQSSGIPYRRAIEAALGPNS